jgi:hypothetical protein
MTLVPSALSFTDHNSTEHPKPSPAVSLSFPVL